MVDPELDELWQRVLAAWDDDAAHSAFIEHCRATRQLGEACGRYREQVRQATAYRDDATRSESARKRLNGIVTLVMLELNATKTSPDDARSKLGLVAVRWTAALLCLAATTFFVMQLLRR